MSGLVDRLKQLAYETWLHPRHLSLAQRKRALARFEPSVTGNLLDVGCGRKPYKSLFGQTSSYIGIDLPGSMHGIQEVDVLASALALPFSSNSFDAVLCVEVLEHTTDPSASIVELTRVLCGAGVLLLTAPLDAPLHEEPYDYFRFTKYGLALLIEQAGLKMSRILPLGGTWLSLGHKLSGFLYRTLGARTGLRGEQIPRLVLGPIVSMICAVIQVAAVGLESIWFEEAGTMGYAILAQKPVPAAESRTSSRIGMHERNTDD